MIMSHQFFSQCTGSSPAEESVNKKILSSCESKTKT